MKAAWHPEPSPRTVSGAADPFTLLAGQHRWRGCIRPPAHRPACDDMRHLPTMADRAGRETDDKLCRARHGRVMRRGAGSAPQPILQTWSSCHPPPRTSAQAWHLPMPSVRRIDMGAC